jgi:HSP20 family molecular chaperone IbpA
MGDKIEFMASLPAIQSAVSVSGNGDGARIKLDVPGTDLPQAIKLLLYTNQTFKVTITGVSQ